MPDTYYAKPVVNLAPDALIYLNGKESVYTCLRCRKEASVINDVTNLSVTLTLEGKAAANFTIVSPKHDPNRWQTSGQTKILPMFEVEIFMRGRFLVNGEPRYYPVFWGIVSSVEDGYSDGQETLAVTCDGILRWWEITKVNATPSVTDAQIFPSSVEPSVWTNIFGDLGPYDIMWHLATTATGGLLTPQGFDGRYAREVALPTEVLRNIEKDMMEYWSVRFLQASKYFRMFGHQGQALEGEIPTERPDASRGQDLAKAVQDKRFAAGVANPPVSTTINPTSDRATKTLSEYKTFGQPTDKINLFSAEMTSKLELATHVKNAVQFEFYQDSTGELIFKPPFYNVDVRPFPPYVIEDIDIVSMNFTEQESEVITRVDVKGSFGSLLQDKVDTLILPQGFYVDPELVRRFGLRAQTINMNYLLTSSQCFAYAVGEMGRLNKRRYSGQMTIMGRPELRVGFPIYIKSRDIFAYVVSISHSFTFGSSFKTTLGLEAVRKKRYSGGDSPTPGVIEKNQILEVTVVETQDDQAKTILAAKAQAKKGQEEREKNEKPGVSAPTEEKLSPKAPPGSAEALDGALARGSIEGVMGNKVTQKTDASIIEVQIRDSGKTALIPFTDKEGYEVFGGFPYGRNIEVTPRGDLRIRSQSDKEPPTTKVGTLFTSIEQGIPGGTDNIEFASTLQVTRRQLGMVPDTEGPAAEGGVADLAANADATLETGLKGVTQIPQDERQSLLNLEPGIHSREEATKCNCGRELERIQRIMELREKKAQEAARPVRASTQPEPPEFAEEAFEDLEEV